MDNFISAKYQELREEEQLFFQAAPSMRVAKKLIQVAALPPAAAVAATHAPIVGPAIAAGVGQATHMMQSGMHGIAADRIANHFSELSGSIKPGFGHWARQASFDAWAKIRTADMLAKTDAWTRPLSGIAAPTMIGKGILDTGKLAISYASQGIPTVVARPVVHMWKMTNHFINRAKNWFEQTLSKLPEQVQQNVRSAMDNIQRRTTAMAESLNPTPSQDDMNRQNDYVRLLSEQQNDPNLTYERIQESIQNTPDLGKDYDQQVASQALQEGKTLDEATAIISQGPNVLQMSETKLQDVSVYLAEVNRSVSNQLSLENPSPEVTQDPSQVPEAAQDSSVDSDAQTVVESNGSAPPPPPEDEDLEQTAKPDPDAQTVAESNGVAPEPADPKLKEQYIQLLSESLGEPDLTWDEVQERVNQDPDLAWEYDERVGVQAQENGIDDPKKLSELIAQAPEPDGVERPKPAAAVKEAKPGLQEDNLEAYRMIKEDVLDQMIRFNNDLGNLKIMLNGEQVMGLNREGAIMKDKTSITTEQAQLIRDALQNPKDYKDVEITIKVGTRIAFRLKNGVAQPDKFGIVKAAEEMSVKIPKATPEQIEKLTKDQKQLIEDLKKQGLPTENFINKMVQRTQTDRPKAPKSEEREVAMSR